MKKTPKYKLVKAGSLATAVLVGSMAVGAGVSGASDSHRSHDSTTTTLTPGAPGAPGAPGHHGEIGGFFGGVVTAVSATSLTVTAPDGTATTYALSSATTYSNNGVAASASAITTGEDVFVVVTATGSTTAASVNALDVQPRTHVQASGVVTAVSASSITIANYAGVSSTYQITPATTVTDQKTASSVANIVVGDHVSIATSSSASSIATSIAIQPSFVAGKVTSVSGNTITVSTWNNQTDTVDVTSSTTYSKGKATASLSAVTVGSTIFAQGSFASASTLTATKVTIGQTGSFSAPLPGDHDDNKGAPNGGPGGFPGGSSNH